MIMVVAMVVDEGLVVIVSDNDGCDVVDCGDWSLSHPNTRFNKIFLRR